FRFDRRNTMYNWSDAGDGDHPQEVVKMEKELGTEKGKGHEVVRIIVEVTKQDHRKVEFDHDQVTDREIKVAAEVPIETDLAARRDGQVALVTDDETIPIENGDDFVVLPLGTIS